MNTSLNLLFPVPLEISCMVLAHLDPRNQANVRRICKNGRDIIDSDQFFEIFIKTIGTKINSENKSIDMAVKGSIALPDPILKKLLSKQLSWNKIYLNVEDRQIKIFVDAVKNKQIGNVVLRLFNNSDSTVSHLYNLITSDGKTIELIKCTSLKIHVAQTKIKWKKEDPIDDFTRTFHKAYEFLGLNSSKRPNGTIFTYPTVKSLCDSFT